jgi:hypothetical protein
MKRCASRFFLLLGLALSVTLVVAAQATAAPPPVSFAPAVTHSLSAVGVLVGDFNNDGNADLATIGNGVSVLLGDGSGNFGQQTGRESQGRSSKGPPPSLLPARFLGGYLL